MRRGGGTPSVPGLCSAGVLTGWQAQVKGRLRAKREKAEEVTKAPTELKQAICLWLGWAVGRIHELHSSVLRNRSMPTTSHNLQAGGSAEKGGKALSTVYITKWNCGPCCFSVHVLPKNRNSGSHVAIQALGNHPSSSVSLARQQRKTHTGGQGWPCTMLSWKFRQHERLTGVSHNLITRLVSETSW